MKNSTVKETIERTRNYKYQLLLEGMAVGLITGVVVAMFRLCLEKAQQLREWYLFACQESILFIALTVFVIGFLALMVATLVRTCPLISGSGIPQVKGELKGSIESVWWKVLICKFVGGILAIGGGLSLGREGPSIQLGAMMGKGFSRVTKRLKTEEKMLMTCGAGAGLAAAFNAPLAGVVFALEELHKNFSTEVLLTTMGATVASDFVSSYIFGLAPVFSINVESPLPLSAYWAVIILGIVLGIMGVLYNKTTEAVQNMYVSLKIKGMKSIVPWSLVVVLAIAYPKVLGSGHELVAYVSQENLTIVALVVLFVLKYAFSIMCFGSGAPGGIFLPLLVMGGILGGLCSTIGSAAGFGSDYIDNFVILGMAGYFSAIVRAPITGVILITEMTGDFSSLLPLVLVSLSAYIVADLLKGQPIYEQLLDRLMRKNGKELPVTGSKILIDSDVYFGSSMDGEAIQNLSLPEGCLIVSVRRGKEEIVPGGQTVLMGGDKITVICDEKYTVRVVNMLNIKCKKAGTTI